MKKSISIILSFFLILSNVVAVYADEHGTSEAVLSDKERYEEYLKEHPENEEHQIIVKLKDITDTDIKESEIKKMGFSYIKKEDIWNALKNQKWNKSSNLTLYEMVDDILNSSPSYFDDYIKKVFNETKRNINLKEEDIL